MGVALRLLGTAGRCSAGTGEPRLLQSEGLITKLNNQEHYPVQLSDITYSVEARGVTTNGAGEAVAPPLFYTFYRINQGKTISPARYIQLRPHALNFL